MVNHQPELTELGRLWARVARFITENQITEAVDIWNNGDEVTCLPELVAEFCDIVGYAEPENELSVPAETGAPEAPAT